MESGWGNESTEYQLWYIKDFSKIKFLVSSPQNIPCWDDPGFQLLWGRFTRSVTECRVEVRWVKPRGLLGSNWGYIHGVYISELLTCIRYVGGIQCCLLLLATSVLDLRILEIEANAILRHSLEFDTSTHLPKSQTQKFFWCKLTSDTLCLWMSGRADQLSKLDIYVEGCSSKLSPGFMGVLGTSRLFACDLSWKVRRVMVDVSSWLAGVQDEWNKL